MPSIPLPFVVSLVLAIVLVRMVRLGRESLGLFPLLVAAFAIQAALAGLNWSAGWPSARLVQPVLAAALPALAFAAFAQLRSGQAARPANLWPHFLPAGVVACLVVVWRAPIDLALFAIYLGYGTALLRLARRGPGVLAATRLGDERTAHLALVVMAVLLVATAFADAAVAFDLAFADGRRATIILTVASVVWLAVAGFAATIAQASHPAVDRETADELPEPAPFVMRPRASTAPTGTDDPSDADRDVLQRLDALMAGRRLYRDPDLTLERLARRAGIPARRISGAVNRIHGQNVSQFVNALRIEEAKTRLRETGEPVTAIMLDVGFGTKSNFNREFLRVTGMSPSAWRRSGASGIGDPGVSVPASCQPGS